MDVKQIAKRMYQARKARGLTQRAIAKKLGLTQSNYSYYERGLRRFPIAFCEQVAEVLGVDINWLLFGIEGPTGVKEKKATYKIGIPIVEAIYKGKKREAHLRHPIGSLALPTVENLTAIPTENLGSAEVQEGYLLVDIEGTPKVGDWVILWKSGRNYLAKIGKGKITIKGKIERTFPKKELEKFIVGKVVLWVKKL